MWVPPCCLRTLALPAALWSVTTLAAPAPPVVKSPPAARPEIRAALDQALLPADPAEKLRRLNVACQLARSADDRTGLLIGLRRTAALLASLGKPGEARDWHLEAAALSSGEGWAVEELRDLNDAILIEPELRRRTALTWQAADLIREFAGYSDGILIGADYVCWKLMDRGELGLASLLIDPAYQALEKSSGTLLERPSVLSHIALINLRLGNSSRAVDHQTAAVQLYALREDPEGRSEAVTAHSVLGGILLEAGRLEEAVAAFNQSLTAAAALPGPVPLSSVESLAGLTQACARLHRVPEGRAHLARGRELLAMMSDLGQQLTDYETGVLDFSEAMLHEGESRPAEAVRLLERARSGVRSLAPDSLDEAAILRLIWDLADRADRGALRLPIARELWRIHQLHVGGLVGDEVRLAFAEANPDDDHRLVLSLIAAGDVEAAYRVIEEGRAAGFQRSVLDRRIRAAATDPRLRALFDQAMARVLTARGRQAQAERALETARLEARAAIGQGAAAAPFREREDRAEAARDRANRVLSEAVASAQAAQDRLRGTAVGASAEPLGDVSSLALPPAGGLLLSYSVGEHDAVVFAVDNQGQPQAALIPLGRRELELRVVRAMAPFAEPESLRSRQSRGSMVAPDRSPLRDLAAATFPTELRARIGRAKRLLLSLDECLLSLPVNVLPLPAGCGALSGRLLGTAIPVTRIASLRVFQSQQAGGHRPTGQSTVQALVVGDPTGKSPARPQRMAARRGKRDELFAPLPAADQEARSVAATWGVRPLLKEQATLAAVQARLSSAILIHIATHGTPGGTTGSLILAPAGTRGRGVSGTISPRPPDRISALEFMLDDRLRLKAELVVLSACESGVGRKVAGEGLVGLPRALQIAGARSVVCSLWKVNDASTRELMVSFHRSVRRGLDYDIALMDAMREQHRRKVDPYLWAGFMLIGPHQNRLAAAPKR